MTVFKALPAELIDSLLADYKKPEDLPPPASPPRDFIYDRDFLNSPLKSHPIPLIPLYPPSAC